MLLKNPQLNQIMIKSDKELEFAVSKSLEKGIHTLLIEGGSKLIGSFYDLGLWDEVLPGSARSVDEKTLRATDCPEPKGIDRPKPRPPAR